MTTNIRFPFENIQLPLEERVTDLVSRFTLDEKIESMVQYQPAIERLGVKAYKHGTEAAHGMAWLGEATTFPQPIGLGCTWNPELMKEIGSVIGDEARVFYQRNPAVNGLTLWAPTVDMERDPRWGRTEEAYGEDPKLTGELTAALVQGIQGDHPHYFKAVATLKHFIGNNNEINRGSCSASIDPRNMKEYYQAAFKPAFVKGGAHSMMTSYNSVNGTPTILHEDVNKVVKGEWGMNGFVVSDAGDLLGIVNDHKYYDSYKDAVAHAIKAGIDSITDDKEKSCAAIREALAEGLLTEADLDKALINTFRVRFRLGEFDPADRVPYADVPDAKLCAPEHAQLSLRAARESVVLLKNEGGALPLDKEKLSSVAVIGPLADVVYRDWYSGTLPYKVTPLGGIKRKLEGKVVTYCSGGDRIVLRSAASGRALRASVSDGGKLSAADEGAEGDLFELTDWGWGSYTLESKASGKLLTSADDVNVAAAADEAFGWFVKEVFKLDGQDDGRFAIRTWNGKPVTVAEGGTGSLQVKNDGAIGEGELFMKDVVASGIAEAVAAAKASEAAIVVVGNNPLINGKEEIDRPGLALAASQNELIRAVHAANPNTVVVVVGSYPFALNEANRNIPAIVYLSHAGQELGNAVADVLFGDYSPAGRLNMTWYQSEEQLTDLMDYDILKGKRTYLYFDGEPLYPFGHGLSYGAFRYGELELANEARGIGGSVTARLQVTNESAVAADEVVQLYVRAEGSRVRRPLKKLVGFARIGLLPGETKQVELAVPAEELAIWDVTRDRFCLETASYTFTAGGSSADAKASATIAIEGERIPARDLSVRTRAENYDDYAGVYLDESKEGGTCVRPTGTEGWIAFADADWSNGSSVLEARVSGGAEGGSLTVRIGGELAGSAEIAAGGEQEWRTIRIELSPIASLAGDLVIALKGDVRLSAFNVR
ncbi:glycoside hydrolase family 3 C-terminal domain-containing protein [Paenibacillus arenilitoris]|uniref:Glycoside hydrolase family 3 C-terminal domain-containing protein n=1 Tax=Paenibacillus arenilitoris TaxID=2772299 RepID=A0A927CVD3_9BACL|nr:glycoside hydrolase family 3 C-terminal domain-containing protein [Paenibacillus arenilitoris]MBD2872516.1 glycoside hydrolase family 3 C-terminal domain-containing protein [Paenibacillus arenilitoris]